MIQNILIVIVVVACAWFVGRRIYTNLRGTRNDCGCGCSGCDQDMVSSCQSTRTDPDSK